MLQKHGQYNDLSTKFRTEMEAKVKALGKKVKFRFNIARENPDPEKYDGRTVFPNMYTLDPRTFRILDPHEDRSGVSKSKEIGLVDKIDRDGKPESFHRIRIHYRDHGEKVFNIEESYDDFEFVLYLLLHPKLKNGAFQDSSKTSIFELIDEQAVAKDRKEKREARLKATKVASEMEEEKVKEFSDAMQWDETDVEIMRDRLEDLAETEPGFFTDLVNGKNIEYQAIIKRALDKKVVEFDPAEHRWLYGSNKQLISTFSKIDGKGHIEQFSDWCQTGGPKAEETYKRIKGLVNK